MAFSTEIRERRAFVSEIKFLIPDGRAAAIREWARARLEPDPYGGGPRGDEYRTASLYFDTSEFDVFHRRGSFGRSKYRIRRYGAADLVFLERKLKTHDWVGKRRSTVGTQELHRLGEATAERGWAGHWFHRRVLARELNLVCRVSYSRTALIAADGGDAARLTLDVELQAAATDQIAFPCCGRGLRISENHAVLELKYRGAAPPVFQELIETFSLVPQAVSKYRMAIAALGCMIGGGTKSEVLTV